MTHSQDALQSKLVQGVFFRTLHGVLTPEAEALLAKLGIVRDGMPETLPRTVWYRAIDAVSASLYPSETLLERHRHLGHQVIAGMADQRIVPRSILAAVRLLGPRRALTFGAARVTRAPLSLSVEDGGERSVIVRTDELEQPDFLAGMLEAVVKALWGKAAHVAIAPSTAGLRRFQLTWDLQ